MVNDENSEPGIKVLSFPHDIQERPQEGKCEREDKEEKPKEKGSWCVSTDRAGPKPIFIYKSAMEIPSRPAEAVWPPSYLGSSPVCLCRDLSPGGLVAVKPSRRTTITLTRSSHRVCFLL